MNERIRWDCRRGMLELDLVLARFLDLHLARLTEGETEAFRKLLACSDPDLWGMIQGKLSEQGDTARVLELLRQC